MKFRRKPGRITAKYQEKSLLMKHSKYFVTILASIVLSTGLFSVERDQALLTEDFASPNVANFDCHSSCIIETSPGDYVLYGKEALAKAEQTSISNKMLEFGCLQFKNGKWNILSKLLNLLIQFVGSNLNKATNGDLILFYRIGSDPRQRFSF